MSSREVMFDARDIRTWPSSIKNLFLYLSIVHAAFWCLVVMLATGWRP